MSWARFDDQAGQHPKILQAGPIAGWLWFKSVLYCAQYRTDGWVPAVVIPTLADFTEYELPPMAEPPSNRLIRLRLWEVVPLCRACRSQLRAAGNSRTISDAIYVHDFLEYNQSRGELEAIRTWDRSRKARQRQAKFDITVPVSVPVGHNRDSRRIPDSPSPSPSPSLPLGRGREHPPKISGSSDRPERTVKPWPKPARRVGRTIRVGRQKITIPGALRPIVDTWRTGFEARFGHQPESPKPWDLSAAEELLERHGLGEVLTLVEGAMRVGTKRMRDGDRWSLQAIQDDWNVLVAMQAKGELR